MRAGITSSPGKTGKTSRTRPKTPPLTNSSSAAIPEGARPSMKKNPFPEPFDRFGPIETIGKGREAPCRRGGGRRSNYRCNNYGCNHHSTTSLLLERDPCPFRERRSLAAVYNRGQAFRAVSRWFRPPHSARILRTGTGGETLLHASPRTPGVQNRSPGDSVLPAVPGTPGRPGLSITIYRTSEQT